MRFDDFKTVFFKGNSNKRLLINQIKGEFNDLNALQKFVNRFRKEIKVANSLLNQELLGRNSFPTKYSEIKSENHHQHTGSVLKELNWFALAFIDGSEKINLFLKYRNGFEKNLLLGNYDNARKILEQIENEVSLSLWTIENRFILDEYQYGTEKNWEFRNDVLDENNNTYLQVLGNLFSLKIESRISFFQFNDSYTSWEESQNIVDDPQYQGILEYFRFRSNFFLSKNYHCYDLLFFLDNNSALIDRYNLFIRVIQKLFTEDFDAKHQILDTIKILKDFIEDNCLEQLIAIQDSNHQISADLVNSEIMDVIDLYTSGQYQKCKDKCSEMIIANYANVPELYEIYVKALIESRSDYASITKHDSFANTLTKLYYDTLSKTTKSDDVFIELLKLAYIFNNSSLGIYIYEFVREELGWSYEINYAFLAHLNSHFFNPKMLNHIHANNLLTKNILTKLTNSYPKSTTISTYFEFYNNFKNDIPPVFSNIPQAKNKIYALRWLMLKDKYAECIEPYKELKKENLSPINFYEVINSLFLCYLETNDPRSNLILYVDSYLENPQITKKLETSILLDSIVITKFKNIGDKTLLIELPILFRLLSTDKIKIKQACELFLSSNGFSRPSELIVNSHLFDKNKVSYFFSTVCTIEILQLSKAYQSTYAVNEERIKICQFLANFDVTNIDTYNAEIANLTQKNSISKVIGKIDDGKIYVNEEKIKQVFLKSEPKNDVSKIREISVDNFVTKEFFLRTMDLKKFVANNEYKRSKKLFFVDMDNQGKISNNPAFNDFKKMFFEVRNYFVWSKEYGLDAYLSTRIRHGTLINHIRSVFELFSLVTTQVDGHYAENEKWAGKIKGDSGNIQTLLSKFSKDIDEILVSLKEEVIQCRTEQANEKIHAMFDFSYIADLHLMILYLSESNNNYDDFLNLCFNELWARTNTCLENIRVMLDEQIKEGFVRLLNKLEEDLLQNYKKPLISELLNNLNFCRTEIQTKMNNVIKWFNRSESVFEGEYNLNVLIDTSVQITKNIHPTYNFEVETNVSENIIVSGENHQNVIDLINNCLFNMIKHADLENDSLEASIIVSKTDDLLKLDLKNNVKDINKHLEKLERIKKNWTEQDSNITGEEGSGYPKIKKIIHSDLSRKKSSFDYKFENNYLTITMMFETNAL